VGDLDFLLVDLPPGTGDAQLSLCQTVPLDGGVIISTPQEASLGVVRKGIAMFRKVNVPILGHRGKHELVHHAERRARRNFWSWRRPGGGRAQNVPFLGEVPIFTEIREGGDAGLPIVSPRQIMRREKRSSRLRKRAEETGVNDFNLNEPSIGVNFQT